MDILEYDNRKEYLEQFIDDEENTIFISAYEGKGIDEINKVIDNVKKIERKEYEYQ